MKIVTFACQHGGVGKTTSAVTIAYALAQSGHNTILIDLEKSGQCSLAFGLPMGNGVYEWLISKRSVFANTITLRNGLHLLRSDSSTQEVQRRTSQGYIRSFDLVSEFHLLYWGGWAVLDAPKEGVLGEVAIIVADVIVVPFRGDGASLDGLFATMQMISDLNPKAEVILLPTMIDMHIQGTRDVLSEVEKGFPGRIAPAIPKRVAVAKAVDNAKTIWEYDGARIEEVKQAYKHLLNRVLIQQPDKAQNAKFVEYQRQVDELQSQLAEANAWRERHDTQSRLDALEANLFTLQKEVSELNRLFNDNSAKLDKPLGEFEDSLQLQ